MTRVLLPMLALLSMACAPDSEFDAHTEALAVDTEARQAKVDVCHVDEETGEWFPINISENAVDAHLDNHGDWYVEDAEVCSDGIDNDCDGEIDEDCCPCNDTWAGLLELASAYVDDAFCWSWEEGYDPAEWTDAVALEGYGFDSDGFFGQIYSVDWGVNVEPFYGDYSCAYYYIYTDETGEIIEDFGLTEINEFDHESCKNEIVDIAASVGLECEAF